MILGDVLNWWHKATITRGLVVSPYRQCINPKRQTWYCL